MLESNKNFSVGDKVYYSGEKIYGVIRYVTEVLGFVEVVGLDGWVYQVINGRFLTHVSAEELETAEVIDA